MGGRGACGAGCFLDMAFVRIKHFPPAKRRNGKRAPHKQAKAAVREHVKANSRYISHRRGKEGEKLTRQLFGHDGKLTKEEVYAMIDASAPNTYFHKLIINPDPRREDWDKGLNLRELTLQTIAQFEATTGKQLQFFAAVHNDHSDKRHVHAVVLVAGRLPREVFKALPQALRQAASKEALFQRHQLDQALGITREQTFERPPAVAQLPHRSDDLRVGRPGKGWQEPTPPPCPRCDTHMAFFGNHCLCPLCGLKFALEPELNLGREVGREW
jgi:hypothetical protein